MSTSEAAPLRPNGISARAKSASPRRKAAEWQPHPIMALYRDHQIDVPLAIVLLTFTGAFLSPSSVFAKFAFVTHPFPNETDLEGNALYGKGPYDVAFVAFYVTFWTFMRAFVIDYFLKPLARKAGVRRALWDRFGEQGWLVIYYSMAFSVGFYFAYNSPFWRNTKYFWIDYPHIKLTGAFKAYYLVQLAFWIQQLFVVHIEKPRKDYAQYVAHHWITIALVASSYASNFTRIGNAIFACMDVADIFLSGAKCLNYARWRKSCDATFVLFVGVWVYSRHYVYNHLLYSAWAEYNYYIPLIWDPANGYFVSPNAHRFFIVLLSALQLLLLFWLYLIIRVVVRVVSGNGANDNRSDSEDSDYEPEAKKDK